MNVPQKHQLKIAKQSLRMTPAMARAMGGMTFEQAYELVFHTPLRPRLESLVAQYGDHPKDLSWELWTYGWDTPRELLDSLNVTSI